MDNKIKKAISRAMGKLVGFALNERATKGNDVQVNFLGANYTHRIWVGSELPGEHFKMIVTPVTVEDVPRFECKIEKAIAEMKAKFEQPADVLANLNTETNE